ncbi:MAG: glycine oxidase ThiO [Nitriliruptorales bacterium]|nr:glycine oxidase ThiO [Nitriliruptorales bacterium]
MTAHGADRDVVVVGGGIIGRAVAWQLALAGCDVELFDPDPSRAASLVAAGMLAPMTEATPEEGYLAALGMASAARWPAFSEKLEDAAGRSVNFRSNGTLYVAADLDGLADLEVFGGRLSTMGLEVEWLTGARCREREPLLVPTVRGGLFAAGDHVVEPREVVAALTVAMERAGVTETRQPVRELADDGVALADGSLRRAGHVVLAVGAWSGRLFDLPVHPVRGETLHLARTDHHPGLVGNVRAVIDGQPVYLAPRGDGRLVVGSTMDERGFDLRTRVGPVRELLERARAIVPAIDEMELAEIAVGLRPGTPDNGPLIGEIRPGVIAATGHHRNGILLAPITTDAVVAIVTGGDLDPAVKPFDPNRFAAVA